MLVAAGLLLAPQASASEAGAEDATDFVSCTPPPSDMTAWWGFEKVAGGNKKVADLTGNQPIGKLRAKASRSKGKVANAAKFDGSGAHVRVPNTDLQIGTGDFSIDFWIKTTGDNRRPDVIFDNRKNLQSGFHVYTWKGRPGIQVGGDNFTANTKGGGYIADNQWHFVAITVDAANGTGLIYVNGELNRDFQFDTGRDHDGPKVMLGDRLSVGGNEPLTGSLDEVEVFNRQLSDQEVTDIFEAGRNGKCKVSVEETKALLAEALASDGEVDEEECECVFKRLLGMYKGDLNRLHDHLAQAKPSLAKKIGKAIELCQEVGVPVLCARPPENMVAWYPMNQSGEQIVPGGLPNANAIDVGLSNSGVVGNAGIFNGTSAMLEVASPPSIFGSGDVAIDFWMKSGDQRKRAISIFDNRDSSDLTKGFHVYTYRGRLGLQFSADNYTSAVKGLNDGAWHFVAISFDSSSNTATFYVDGDVTDTFNVNTPAASLDGGPVRIGKDNGIGGNRPYEGELDELELFRGQLSKKDMDRIFQAGQHGKCPSDLEPVEPTCVTPPAGMIGWYPFDDGQGHQIAVGGLEAAPGTDASPIGGKVDGAAKFNGSTTMFEVDSPSAMFGAGDFAIDFWMQTGDSSSSAISIFDNRDPADLTKGFHVYTYRGAVGLQLSADNYTSSYDDLNNMAWHLVAISYDSSAQVASFYVDGVLTDEFTITNPATTLDGGNIRIGRDNNIGGNNPYEGNLDEVELFNMQLSAGDVEAIFNAGDLGKCKPQVG